LEKYRKICEKTKKKILNEIDEEFRSVDDDDQEQEEMDEEE
jgi:hypothetical protein